MIAALFYAAINWNFIKRKPEKWFIAFLSITVVIDLLGVFFRTQYDSKLQIYSNLIILLTNLILFYWFYEYLKNKTLLIVSITVMLLSFIVGSFFQNPLYQIAYYANFAIAIVLLINIFRYFQKLLNTNDVLQYKKAPAFWISIGIIIYQLNLVVVFFLLQDLVTMTKNIYYTIITTVSFILYGSIIFGILLNKKNG